MTTPVASREPTILAASSDDTGTWIREHRGDIEEVLSDRGAVVVRGDAPLDIDGAAELLATMAGDPVYERESFAPRTRYGAGVYSSTVWPAGQRMCMHHELSYRLDVPAMLLFGCRAAPESGGETTLSDDASVLRALPADLVERVSRDGWILRRAYIGDVGASLSESFGTDDRRAAEAYCRAHAIEFDWRGGVLHTRQRRPAIVRHPADGRLCWFNQLAFLSEWTMDPDVRTFLLGSYGPDSLPFNTSYGDGSPVEREVVDLIGEVYAAHTERHAWSPGDVMIVDNVRTAHGRESFVGERDLLVGLGRSMRHCGSDIVR